MAKKNWIFIFLAVFFIAFVIGYVIMAFDIKSGILGEENRNIWQILFSI